MHDNFTTDMSIVSGRVLRYVACLATAVSTVSCWSSELVGSEHGLRGNTSGRVESIPRPLREEPERFAAESGHMGRCALIGICIASR